MSKKALSVVSILLCILVLACYCKITSLNHQIEIMQTNFMNRISQLQNSIDNIPRDIQYNYEESNSNISSTEFSYKDINVKEKTIKLSAVIKLKEFKPGITQASIIYNGTSYKLDFHDNIFTTEVTVPLFQECNISDIVINENENTYTEEINEHFSPTLEFLPMFNVSFPGNVSMNKNSLVIKSTLYVDAKCQYEFSVDHINIVEVTDGVETCVNTLDNSRQSNINVFTENYDYNKEVVVPNNSKVEIYADIYDGNGFKHRVMIASYSADSKGKTNDTEGEFLSFIHVNVYDENDYLLYEYN